MKNKINLTTIELRKKIEEFSFALPKFQRDFVWTNKEAALLLDSIDKGYYIGRIVLWPHENKDYINDWIHDKDKYSDTEEVNYVVDGQQRITTLYALTSKKAIGAVDPEKLFVSLDKDTQLLSFSNEQQYIGDEMSFTQFMSIYLETQAIMPKAGESDTFFKKLHDLKFKLKTMKVLEADVLIKARTLSSAVDQFNRINITGKRLTSFDIFDSLQYTETNKLIADGPINEWVEEFVKGDETSTLCRGRLKDIFINTILLALYSSKTKFKDWKTKEILYFSFEDHKAHLAQSSLDLFDPIKDAKMVEKILNIVKDTIGHFKNSILPDNSTKLLASPLVISIFSYLAYCSWWEFENPKHAAIAKDYNAKFAILKRNDITTTSIIKGDITMLYNDLLDKKDQTFTKSRWSFDKTTEDYYKKA